MRVRFLPRSAVIAGLIATALLLSSCGSTADAVVQRDALVAYGDSYIAGHYNTPPPVSLREANARNLTYVVPWVIGAARRLHRTLIERGRAGSIASQVLSRVDATWSEGEHVAPGTVVVVEVGLNDVRRYGTAGVGRYRADLKQILVRLASGRPTPRIAVVLAVPIPDWTKFVPSRDHGSTAAISAYDAAASAIAHSAGALVIDPRPGWNVHTMISADGLHPNPLGSAHITAAALKVLG